MKQYIEFKKQREMGQILSDTFAFLRNDFKSFFTTFFKLVGPYLVAMIICYGFYLYQTGDFIQRNDALSSSMGVPFLFFTVTLAFLIALITSYIMAQATTIFYIKSYIKNEGNIDFDEIKQNVYDSFWKFIGLGFLVAICAGFGFLFCLIPGIYVYVPLSLSFCLLAFENKGVSDAFSDSFKLVKDYWWITFASLFVVGIIVMVTGYAFALPGTIYNYAKMGILSGEIDVENFGVADPISIALGSMSILAQFLLNIISVVAGVLIYFDLNEKKNFTGTYERIKNLGRTFEE
ncbi:hypothetical protein Q4603_16425 [Zobellia galactanivorans]|uniref:hypothetical protein n=1 Tax=Zobellia TaxID=112040 RepID=UPI000B53710B|nr:MULTISPECIES: hypothetical protein [Zobellia]MBU3026949.1 hypothetical protein [Zobellia galactanivorans]MDO6810213.1 hypothetical protein [Zobellia galactanivorans]OWW23803.1 hypothetical protein B4Q04_18815 [Zobellia sp. OII3]